MDFKHDKSLELVKRDEQVYSKFSRIPYYPLGIKQGRGSIIEDMDGNKFIDMLSAASSLNTGHSHLFYRCISWVYLWRPFSICN